MENGKSVQASHVLSLAPIGTDDPRKNIKVENT